MGVPDPKRGGVDYPEIGKVLQVRDSPGYTVPFDCILLGCAGVEYGYGYSQGYISLVRNGSTIFGRGNWDSFVDQYIVDAKEGDILHGSTWDYATVSYWRFLGPPDAIIKDNNGTVLTHAAMSNPTAYYRAESIGTIDCNVYSPKGKKLGSTSYAFYESVPA